MDLLLDVHFWISLSFALFVFILVKFGKPGFFALLDKKIEQIKQEIESAESLRSEAQDLLAQYKLKQRDASKEAERILEEAKKSAKQFQKKAEADLDASMKKKEQQLAERLDRMKIAAKQEIQSYAAQLAVRAAQEIIIEKLDNSAYEKLAEQSANQIEQKTKTLN